MVHPWSSFRNWLTGYLPNETLKKNVWFSNLDAAFVAIVMGLTGSFMSVYALKLGASEQMLAVMSSGPALMALLAQVPSAMMTERTVKKKKPILVWVMLHRIWYLVFAIIPFLPVSSVHKAWLFITLVTLMNFPANVANVMWTQMMGEIIPTGNRGRVFGDRNFLAGWFSLGSMMIAGPLLDYIPYPYNYTLLFGLSFISFMISTIYLARMEEVMANEAPATSVRSTGVWEGFKLIFKDKQFMSFVLAAFVFNMGFGISSSMWTINYVRDLHLTNTQIAFASILSSLATTLSYPFWGRTIDRIGSKSVYLISLFIFIFRPWIQAIVTPETLWLMWWFSFATGIAQSGFNLSQFNTLLVVAPDPNKRPSYLAFFNIAVQTVTFIFPMIGVQIYKALGNQVAPVFYLSTVIRVIGASILAWSITKASRKKAA